MTDKSEYVGLLTRREFSILRAALVCILVAVVVGFLMYMRDSANIRADIASKRVACEANGGALIVNKDYSTACVPAAQGVK